MLADSFCAYTKAKERNVWEAAFDTAGLGCQANYQAICQTVCQVVCRRQGQRCGRPRCRYRSDNYASWRRRRSKRQQGERVSTQLIQSKHVSEQLVQGKRVSVQLIQGKHVSTQLVQADMRVDVVLYDPTPLSSFNCTQGS